METQPVLVLQPGIYHSYLVRIWREEPEMPWRASAQCVQTGETHRFATVEALFAFLTEQTGEQGAGSRGHGTGLSGGAEGGR